MPFVYNPTRTVEGWDYWRIGYLLRIILERCDREEVRELCEEALAREVSGLELRNNFLLNIRAGLQEWKSGETISYMIKTILSGILFDSVEGGDFPYQQLSLDTYVAFDPSKLLKERLQHGHN